MLALHYLAGEFVRTARHGQIHDNAEEERRACFQHTGADFVAPGRGEMPHPVDKGFACGEKVQEQHSRHQPDDDYDHTVYHFCGFCGQHRADRARKKAQKDGKKGEIADEIHIIFPPFSTVWIFRPDPACDISYRDESSGTA